MTTKLRLKIKTTKDAGQPERDIDVVENTKSLSVKMLKPVDQYNGMRIKILGVPFGGPEMGRDSDGECFHPDTNIWMLPGQIVPLTYLHGFGPDDQWEWQNPPTVIGVATYIGVTDAGHMFDAVLDENEPLALRVANALSAGEDVKASSGAINHLCRSQSNGMIDVWPVGEMAVFDCNDWRQPANRFAVVTCADNATEDSTMMDDNSNESSITPTTVIIAPDAGKTEPQKSAKAETVEADLTDVENGDSETKTNDTNTTIQNIEENLEMPTLEEIQAFIDQKVEAALSAKSATVAEPTPVTSAPISMPAIKKVTGMGFSNDDVDATVHYWKTGIKSSSVKTAFTETDSVLVPPDINTQITTKLNEDSFVRKAISASGGIVFSTTSNEYTFPTESVEPDLPTDGGETDDAIESESVITPVKVNLPYSRRTVWLSKSLLNDTPSNLLSFVNVKIAQMMALRENQKAVTALMASATLGATFAATSALSKDDISTMYSSLKSAYRNGAGWLSNPVTDSSIMDLQGQWFLYQQTPSGKYGSDKYPNYWTEYMPLMGAGLKSLIFGNFRYLGLVENTIMTVQRLDQPKATQGLIGLLFEYRNAVTVTNPDAFKYGIHAAH